MSTETEQTLDEILKQRTDEAVNEAIKSKEAIIEKAKNADNLGTFRSLSEEWKNLIDHDTDREKELLKEFESLREACKKNKEEKQLKSKALKEDIIKEAQDILDSIDNYKEAGDKFNKLMDRWKEAGNSGKESDDRLWGEFNQKRDEFRKRRQEFFQEQDKARNNSQKLKEAIIEDAKELAEQGIEDAKAAGAKMKELMSRWKSAGFAGRETNDKLWEDFCAVRQKFYDRMNVLFEAKTEEYEKVAAVKEGLIEQAKELAAKEDYSPETTQMMKDLDSKWKEAGSAGREKENDLWNRFREAKEVFWEKKHAISEEKRREWSTKAQDIVSRKKDQIEKLNAQIADLKKSCEASSNVGRIMEVKKWIAEKEAIIDDLKKEVKDLEGRM